MHDADVLWGSATRAAYAEAGLVPTFVVVTRDGWVDPPPASGASGAGCAAGRGPRRRGEAQSQVWTGSLVCMRSR